VARWTQLRTGVPTAAVARLQGMVAAAVPRGSARGRLVEAIRDTRSSHPKTARPGQDLRVLVAGPPKAGNLWIKCLLANIYGLRWIPDLDGPADTTLASLERFVERGGFAPGTVFHRHYPYSPELVKIVERVPSCHLVTMLRDPYDQFVSSYYYQQNFPSRFRRRGGPLAALDGKPLDHPDVLAYLEHRFGRVLRNADAWLRSGDSIVIRYEDLHRDPVGTLAGVTERIRPVERAAIEGAVEACSADRMRQMSRRLATHVRSATTGESKQRLGPEHLAIFRERHADLIRGLGYEVR
jgi:hypothetical protein